jgi:hypothetical protein
MCGGCASRSHHLTGFDVASTLAGPAAAQLTGLPPQLQLYAPYFCADTSYAKANGGDWDFVASNTSREGCTPYDFKIPAPEAAKGFYSWFFQMGKDTSSQDMVGYEPDFLAQNFKVIAHLKFVESRPLACSGHSLHPRFTRATRSQPAAAHTNDCWGVVPLPFAIAAKQQCVDRFVEEVGASEAWSQGMNDAAVEAEVALQWCMATPTDLLTSLSYPAVTNFRVRQHRLLLAMQCALR